MWGAMSDDTYANVRDFLGFLIGARVVDITQHDREEWEEERRSYFVLHFDTGATLECPVGDEGFDVFDPKDDEDGPTRIGIRGRDDG